MLKSFGEVLANAKELVLAPLCNVLCLVGATLVATAFVQYDSTHGFSLHRTPAWVMIIIGGLLVVVGVTVFFLSQRDAPLRTRLNYKKGVLIKRGELSITIKEGEIQN